jgi:hypothetical protein
MTRQRHAPAVFSPGKYLCTHWSGVVLVQSSWNVMAHGDAREGKWRGNWRMECVASTLHTTSERSVSIITTADAHTSAASSRLNWRPGRFKWTRPFRRKTKSGFCSCAVSLQTQSISISSHPSLLKYSTTCNSKSGTFISASTNTGSKRRTNLTASLT